MSRQLDLKQEVRESARQDALIRAVEYGIVGALEHQGIVLKGFSIKYQSHDCLMTIKGQRGDKHSVAFLSADTIMNVLLQAYSAASNQALRWRPDQYHKE